MRKAVPLAEKNTEHRKGICWGKLKWKVGIESVP